MYILRLDILLVLYSLIPLLQGTKSHYYDITVIVHCYHTVTKLLLPIYSMGTLMTHAVTGPDLYSFPQQAFAF